MGFDLFDLISVSYYSYFTPIYDIFIFSGNLS